MKTLNKWKVTDPDTNQKGRQISDTKFEFVEDGREQDEIDITDYTTEQIESTISSYGYTLEEGDANNIHTLYGEDANWIIAECLFEM